MREHYVICYDIETQWVRYRIDKLLSGYGERVQYSIFECSLTTSQLVKLRAQICAILSDADRVNYYKMCIHCQKRRLTQGQMKPWQEATFHLID